MSAGDPPFFEPGLHDLLAEVRPLGRLSFTTDPRAAIGRAHVVFICVGTPSDDGGRPELSQLEAAAATIAAHARIGAIVVAKSTVPIGSGDWLGDVIDR